MTRVPEFLVLAPDECRSVLESNHVGRLAFLREGVVDIEPIGYAFEGDWVFARSAYGAKLEAISHHPYVAIEVDEIHGPFQWRSVVAHGTIYVLSADGTPSAQDAHRRAIAALRRAMPGAFTARDPAPERDIVYGLHVDRIEGRMARPEGGSTHAHPPVRKAPGASTSTGT